MRVRGIIAAGLIVGGIALAVSRTPPASETEGLEPPAEPVTWVANDTLAPGQQLGDLFGRHGIGAGELQDVLDLLGLDPRRVPAGQAFRFTREDSLGTALEVTVRTSPEAETRVLRGDSGWTASVRPIRWETHQVRLESTIETSLYDAMTAARLSEDIDAGGKVRLAWDLADVFAWSVDFSRDIQPDDRFVILFERRVSELGESRVGRILASRLEVNGRELTAFHFETPDGKQQYFDQEGLSLKRAFLRAPLEFRRMSSGFSRSRRHPVLGIWRKHEGIDYSADGGTPVMAAGDGTVVRAGWAGGYGRMVELRHRNGVSTRYAHLRGFAKGMRPGSRVSQGQAIGYVGMSGLASGTHLHYEFRQNGVARDPNRVDLGNGLPVPAELRSTFEFERSRLADLLDAFTPDSADIALGPS